MGVDCGGSCERLCFSQTTPLLVKWSRSFRVAPGFYNAFAYIENQNLGAAAREIGYEFTLYDEQNLFIGSRKGAVYVPPNGRFGVFEPAIPTGTRIPKNTLFRIISEPEWLRITEEESKQVLHTQATLPENTDTEPRLLATLENPTILPIKNIDVFAILYDDNGNALSVSKTILEALSPGDKKTVSFTWREPFTTLVQDTEIITQVNVFLNR